MILLAMAKDIFYFIRSVGSTLAAAPRYFILLSLLYVHGIEIGCRQHHFV